LSSSVCTRGQGLMSPLLFQLSYGARLVLRSAAHLFDRCCRTLEERL
jgi:hypothetical protein